MQTSKSALMDAIRQQCPLLAERLSEEKFLALLADRNIYFDGEMLDRAIDAGLLSAVETDDGGVYTRGHLLVVYQLTRHSRIDWFPWDDKRDDRADLLNRRIDAKRAVWTEIESDVDSVRNFYEWFWGDDISAFPASEAVRLTELVRFSLQNIDESGYLSALAESHKHWQEAQGTVLLAAELVRLRHEVSQLLQNARAAGFDIPEAGEVAKDRRALVEAARAIDEENPLYATPPEDADASARDNFVTERDAMMKAEDWFGLVAHFERHADLFEGDRLAEAARQHALATLYSTYFEDQDAAINAYRAMLTAYPGSPSAIAALEEMLSGAERWEEWAEVLGAASEAAEVEEIRDALALARARVLVLNLDRQLDALEIFSRAMTRPGAREDAVALLHDLVMRDLEDPAFDVSAAELLTANDAFATEPEVMIEMYEQIEQRPLSPKERSTLLMAQATLAERHDKPQRAFFRLSQALSHNPISPKIHGELDRLSQGLGNRDELAALLEDEYEKAKGVGSRAFIADRLGRIYAETGRTEEAITLLEVAHEAQPAHKDLLLQLAELYQLVGRADRAIAMLEKLRGLTKDNDELAEIAEVLAELRSQSLDDPKVALETYRGILQKKPDDDEAVVGLLRLVDGDDIQLASDAVRLVDGPLTRADRRNELIDLYSKILDHSNASKGLDRVPLLERVCQLLEKESSRRGQALRRNAQLYALRADPATLAAGRALMAERSDTLIWVVTIREALDSAPEGIRLKLLRQLARTFQEQLRDRKEATRMYQQLLEMKPADNEAYAALERRFRDKEQWQDLVDLKLNRAEAVPEDKVAALMDAAGTLADDMDDLRSAYLVYEQVLAEAPDHPEAQAALDGLLDRTDSPERRLEMLEEIESSAEGTKWVQTRLRRASVMAGQGDADGAIQLLEEAAQRQKGDREILERLESMLRSAERWSEAARVLNQRIEYMEDESIGRRLKRSLAQLYETHMGMADEARMLFDELKAEEETLANAAEAKVRKAEAKASRVDEAEAAISNAANDVEKAKAYDLMAQLLVEQGQTEVALQRLEEALGAVADADAQALVLTRMAAIHEGAGNLDAAEMDLKKILAIRGADVAHVDTLVAFYRRHRILSKLYVLLNFRLNKTPEARTQLSLLAEMANTAQQTRDYPNAISALKKFMDVANAQKNPIDTTKVRRNLATLLARTGQTEESIGILSGLLADPARIPEQVQRELTADLAALHHASGSVGEAGVLVERVLGEEPTHGRMLLLKLDLLVGEDRLAEAQTMAEELRESFSMPLLGGLLARLGRIYASQDDSNRARETYLRLVELEPRNGEARSWLDANEE